MKILDATCGGKIMWFQKNHPLVVYMDKRKGNLITPVSLKNRRTIKINPDVVSEWEDAPFPDNYFDIVIFDPPHIIEKKKESFLTVQFGKLNAVTWKNDLKQGIKKLFSILKDDGVFIFKWNEFDIKTKDVLKLFPYKPLFGSNTHKTWWIVFIKYDVNMKLDKIQT